LALEKQSPFIKHMATSYGIVKTALTSPYARRLPATFAIRECTVMKQNNPKMLFLSAAP